MFQRRHSGFTDIKIANFFHYPVQAKNMNFKLYCINSRYIGGAWLLNKLLCDETFNFTHIAV